MIRVRELATMRPHVLQGGGPSTACAARAREAREVVAAVRKGLNVHPPVRHLDRVEHDPAIEKRGPWHRDVEAPRHQEGARLGREPLDDHVLHHEPSEPEMHGQPADVHRTTHVLRRRRLGARLERRPEVDRHRAHDRHRDDHRARHHDAAYHAPRGPGEGVVKDRISHKSQVTSHRSQVTNYQAQRLRDRAQAHPINRQLSARPEPRRAHPARPEPPGLCRPAVRAPRSPSSWLRRRPRPAARRRRHRRGRAP